MHVCDFTITQISSKYVDEHHTDNSEKEIEVNQFKNRDVPAEGPMLKAPVAPDLLMVSCSKSRTTVGVRSAVPQTSTGK